jgi:hydrogenase expression/formation protein HypC
LRFEVYILHFEFCIFHFAFGGLVVCLAIPVQIKQIDGMNAVVDIGGVTRTVSLALAPDARINDYVLLHAGYAIGIVDEEEARESLKLFKEMAALDGETDPQGK